MQITIIGAGYVGLVSGVCLAELGMHVTCVDKDIDKIRRLTKGEVPIYEPGLDALIAKNMQENRLHFSIVLSEAVSNADVVLIAVGTPPSPKDGKADLSYVYACAEEIAQSLTQKTVIVTKSTVPVGTGQQIKQRMTAANPSAEFTIASNPEFLREGSAIGDFMKPDRIVIGTQDADTAAIMSQLYAPLAEQGYRLLHTDVETAEMIKYASNSFLATKIAFINEMADICEQVGANVELVAKGMGMDERIGERFLRPGPGFGGSCFPKDAMALARLAKEHGIKPNIVNAVIDYNLGRRESMVDRIVTACGSVKDKSIAILGLTFKANTDDMRESPSLSIIPKLHKMGARLRLYDPEGMENAKKHFTQSGITWCESVEDAVDAVDAAVIVTEWDIFRQMELPTIHEQMFTPLIIDLRNLFIPDSMAEQGFDYYSIGRKPALGAQLKQMPSHAAST